LALEPHKSPVSFPAKNKAEILCHGKTIDENAGLPQEGNHKRPEPVRGFIWMEIGTPKPDKLYF
jgi:hypothetical protein